MKTRTALGGLMLGLFLALGAQLIAVTPTFERLKSFGAPPSGTYPIAKLVQGADGALYGAASSGGSGGYGTVFKMNTEGGGFTVLKSFDASSTGAYLYSGLLLGADGALYGTAAFGGSNGYGTVFKLNTDGTEFSVLKNFNYDTTGGNAFGGLVQGTDGKLYGTTNLGGSNGYGTVFKMNTDGSGFTVLQNLDYDTTGGYPQAGLVQGSDGAFYGTASSGGSGGYGTVFKLNADGTGFAVIKNFDFDTGAYPSFGALIQGTDGKLYGTTYAGGSNLYGTVFKLGTDGTGFSVLADLDYATTGYHPYAGVVQGTDGKLYGTASQGDGTNSGTIFKLDTNGTGFSVLKSLDYTTTGGTPYAGLLQGADGNLYGTAAEGGSSSAGTIFTLGTNGNGFSVMKNFTASSDLIAEGGYPFSKLVQGADGKLYGTTLGGGSASGGTVFRMNTNGSSFTVIKDLEYSSTGSVPQGGLVQGADGALYGTAVYGGSNGGGTVFKLSTDGSEFTVLQNLDFDTTGYYPYGGLVQGTDGALYGTAAYGGSDGAGTVFKLNTDGTGFTVIKNLDSSSGTNPYFGALVQGSDGALYGTAGSGGSGGYGTVFKLNTDGSEFTVLKNFDYSSTGGYLYGGLLKGADGTLYGTATAGGSGGYGTLFKLNTDGTGFALLKTFSYWTSGGYLYAGLVQRGDGSLYGTTAYGGSSGYGTVFTLNADGNNFTVLQNFDNGANGSYPYGALTRAGDGNLYGTTYRGGDIGFGTVFRLFGFGDTTTPVITCPPDVTVGWSASYSPETTGGFAAATDDSDPNPVITYTDSAAGVCPTIITRTWKATNAAGNYSTCDQIITVNNLFAEDAIIWLPPLARDGAPENTDPSAGGTVKYRFRAGSTIPIQIRTLSCSEEDITGNSNVTGTVVVFGDADMDGVIDATEYPIDIDSHGVGGPGGMMDKIDGKLKYNLDTGTLPQSLKCYILQVTVTDSSTGESRTEIVLLQADD